jgi:hypothetical protein
MKTHIIHWVMLRRRKRLKKIRKQQIANVRILNKHFIVLEQEFEEGFNRLVGLIRSHGDNVLGFHEF